jgi:hypothetical protein
VAKFNPVSNQFVWAQRAGGTGDDNASALAISGPSVYVTGSFGTTARFGTDYDQVTALAVSGSTVYLAGGFASATADFGSITLTNAGAGTYDVFVAKLLDTGSTGRFIWAQQAGGTARDGASAVAVNGASVYVTGNFASPVMAIGAVRLANAGGVNTFDLFVAKLTDLGSTGSVAWAQRAGGTGDDFPSALTVSGTNVYVAGGFDSPTATFGPVTVSSAGLQDVFVTKLTDVGPTSGFAWAQQAGGPYLDRATAVAVGGASMYVAWYFY